MLKTDHKKAQATVELAVFGAILIFLLGTIVRTAVGNSYTQNQNFKAMRMAMLASWEGTTGGPGNPNACRGCSQNTSHNSAQVLFIEDRLSPDYNKYGDLDRSPFIASGSGSFSYNLLYPLSDASDIQAGLPIMDLYIDGVHFPFTMASYNADLPITPPPLAQCQNEPNVCKQDQCYRQRREWAGGVVKQNLAGAAVTESSFITPTVASTTVTNTYCLACGTEVEQRECQEQYNACSIFTGMDAAGMLTSVQGNCPIPSCITTTDTKKAVLNPAVVTNPSTGSTQLIADSSQWKAFVNGGALSYDAVFSNNTAQQDNLYLNVILNILQGGSSRVYPLFYTRVVNTAGTAPSGFNWQAPSCPAHPCMNNELSQDVPLLDYSGNPTTDGSGNSTNINGVMQYDLLRDGYYSTATSLPPPCSTSLPPCLPVNQQFPTTGCPTCLRNYMAWQWAATAGTTAAMLGINTSNNQYPTYDVDGRLKEVTVYNIWRDVSGTTHVAFEDSQGGDIDQSWDQDSCGPKPGLMQNNMQILTFTQNGTFLQINEGQLYNPQTGQVVRSANKRNSVDIVQRTIQLSNNTGRFCTTSSPPTYGSLGCPISQGGSCVNPVETCVDETQCNCFMGATASGATNPACGNTYESTCYDTKDDIIYVRSRVQDLRGRFWMTNASGQLKVQ